MSIGDYERAKSIIELNKDKASFAGPRSEELIKQAEDALGIEYPETYRQFLLDYGAGNWGSAEFYGVIDDDWDESSVPDGVWYTLNERIESNMPARLVVVGDTGMGELYVIDVSDKAGPVFVVDPGTDMLAGERIASDFGAYFLDQVLKVNS